ncbi:MAG TPA: TetR/AcrR family transcriptional regulator C-terminal domain-containing protein [Amycolatopsis sp.]|uniref:TetR/AcrR family transcriptional regulator n=1 Tax=Amycolatopsis sp. TaxID=37632 RepID=UPI002B4647E1|nr:TetR/AcrR family transcriptional regulator C-terminal domain-containing protein [Amycolatopsis sp.]HKS47665.1 TetR/AcrR family transcriptional regulator C-terminal domain-containing protein [Amycolatopsis sp.]
MPRPRSLTDTGIAAAALAVLDREGLDGLSMRTVAAELGVGTMSLYRYVTDRGQLEGLVIELVLDKVDLTVPARAPAAKRLTVLAERARQAVGEHLAVVPLLLTHRHLSVASRRWGEAVLGVLTDVGFTGKRRVIAFRALLSYLLGTLQTTYFGPLSGGGTAAMAELPVEDYPFLRDTARHAQRVTPDEEFHRGLEIVLRGLGLS